MYKVLIVDDEVLVRIGLRSMIDWNKAGFQIEGEAGNGEAAYEKYLVLRPHVLITDVKMPKKDGLWLIRKVRESSNDVKVIVLTCYDDFEFVREALQLQVTDYVLKAEMEDEELLTIMDRIKEELDKKYALKGSPQENELEEQGIKNLVGLLLDQRTSATGMEEIFQKSGIEWRRKKFCFFQMDFSGFLKKETFTRERTAHILSACCQVIRNRLECRDILCIPKLFGKSITCFLMGERLSQTWLEKEITGLKESVRQYFSISFKSANSRVRESLEEARKDSDWIFQAADLLFYWSNEKHMVQGKEIQIEKGEEQERGQLVEKLCIYGETGREREIREALTMMMDFFKNRCIPSTDAKLEMIYIMNDIIRQYSIYLEGQKIDPMKFQKKVLDSEEAIEVLELMNQFMSQMTAVIGNIRADSGDVLVRKALEYMEKHYMDKLTLDMVSSHVGISRFYFSNLFKKICGVNFSSYLNNLRIQEAKKLLKNPQMNVNQVAFLTGYREPQYFSKIFKKYTGMTVTEYRKGQKK